MFTLGRFLLLSTVALALAACGKKEEAPVAAASDAAVATDVAIAQPTLAPGVYEVTDAAGKKIATTTINADGTYSDDLSDGHRVAGIVKIVDGKTCFDPSGKAPLECFTDSAPAADGSFTATDEKGVVVTVRPSAK